MLIRADARCMPLASESIQCVVTSPPYWGLRKYAGEQELIWSGAVGCEHEWRDTLIKGQSGGRNQGDKSDDPGGCTYRPSSSSIVGSCGLCGAWRGAFGLEPTVEMYVQHTIEILREIGRVLRKDGVCFWNIGDCYATGAGKVGGCPGGGERGETWKNGPKRYRDDSKGCGTAQRCDGRGGHVYYGPMTQPNRMPQNGLKPKDLVLMPARVALAAQADGWWLRSDIVWAKPNPMPESVRDRPTDSYEHILMLSKSGRYFWDFDAAREPGTSGPSDVKKLLERKDRLGGKTLSDYDVMHKANIATQIGQKRAVGGLWQFGHIPKGTHPKGSGDGGPKARARGPHHEWTESTRGILSARNMRNVWVFGTQPYKGAHFATFPEELPRRCIKAASRPGDIVLDPFGGSGTTGRIATELGRRFILLDLAYESGAYKELAERRISGAQIVLPQIGT